MNEGITGWYQLPTHTSVTNIAHNNIRNYSYMTDVLGMFYSVYLNVCCRKYLSTEPDRHVAMYFRYIMSIGSKFMLFIFTVRVSFP